VTTAYTPLLGLALPVTGELSGTWGITVNTAITSLLESAVSGSTPLTTDADVTLSTTVGVANQARSMILVCTGARTAERTLTAPAQSKVYAVINATTGGYGVKLVGAGPTTGVVVPAGQAFLLAWNGSDFLPVAGGGIALDQDLTWTGAQRGLVTTDNDLSFDMNVTNNFSCTPTAGGALTFTNITAGQSGFILLVNGSNYAISAAATTKVGTATLAAISATGTYLLSYFSNGTNVYVVNSSALA